MNSIEAVNDPEKAKQQGKPAERPGPDASPLRVFVKENDKYVLQYETPDFQLAMKKAEQFYKKGQDILVNEKDKPQVVHAKSNLYNNVDVGREITPSSSDGVYIRGRGKSEVVLDSFYEKLPPNTEAFDKQMAAEATKEAAVAKPADQAKAAAPTTKDGAEKAAAPASKDSAEKAAVPAVGAPAAGVKLDKAETDAPGQDAAVTPNRKLILKKTGFDLPEQILTAYVVKDGKYHDKASDALRFQDHGKKLSTPVEDRAVIADMVAIAAAKNWNQIELKGTDTFRQMAWMEAEARGIRTKGYEPTQHDLQQLEQVKRERGVAAERAPDVSQGEKAAKAANTIEVSVEREVKGQGAKAERIDQAAPADASDKAAHAGGKGKPEQKPERPVEATPAQREEHKGIVLGRLVEHGHANFNHDKDEKPSYYVVLDTQAGKRTIWGKDLERSFAAGQHQPGDGLSLQLKGKEPVTVDANVRDDAGKVVGKETIGALRNEWEVKPAVVVLRALSADEKVRVDTATRVLEDTLSKYPDSLRKEIVGKFTAEVEKGSMKLPTPQVAEKANQAKQVRQPEMERTR